MEITSNDVDKLETHLLSGGSLKSAPLSWAKRFGLELYRERNPEWSAKLEGLSRASQIRRAVEFARRRNASRTHCSSGHELTPSIFDRDLAAESPSWNPRACLTCRAAMDAPRFTAEEIEVTRSTLQRVEVKRPTIGKLHRGACKFGHELTPANIVVTITGKCAANPDGYRHHQCRTCVDLSDAEAAEIMQQVKNQVSMRRILLPAKKDCNSLKRYREEHPEWDAILTKLIKANSLAARIAGTKRRFGVTTHCKRGHELTPENRYFTGRTRTCKICHQMREGIGAPITPQQIEQSKIALLTGMSVESIIRGATRIMSPAQWRTLRRTNSEYNKWAIENVQNQRSFVGMQRRRGGIAPIVEIIRAARIQNVTADQTIPVYVAREGDFEWFYGLTPKYLSQHDRLDIVGNIYVALQERRVRREEVPRRIKEFTKQHTDMFWTGEHGSARSPYSLDVRIFEDGSTTRGDNAHIGLWSEEAIY